ncbi:MAG: hypothetical protein ACRDVD_08400 [Acidimicrobiia bacterium]
MDRRDLLGLIGWVVVVAASILIVFAALYGYFVLNDYHPMADMR